MIDNIRFEINRRIADDGIARIKKCLSELNEKQVWHKPNNSSNSVGNLILHLNGNVRQWLMSTMDGQPDTRTRDEEFNDLGSKNIEELNILLDDLFKDVSDFSFQLSSEQLTTSYQVQGYTETGLSIIIHVIEHFSYHVGQITYYTKYVRNVDLGYYDGKDLNEVTE